MDNAELLRLIRKLNVDTWLLLLLCCVLAVAQIQEMARRDADKTFLSGRLARLELWRETAETVREARTAQRAQTREPSEPVPAVKRTARKAGA